MDVSGGVPTVAVEEDEEGQESDNQQQEHAQGLMHEQESPAAGPSPALDVYAFGGLLWAMASGHTLLGAEELLSPPVGHGGGWWVGVGGRTGGWVA